MSDSKDIKLMGVKPSPDKDIYIPVNMTKREAITWLYRMDEEDNRNIEIDYVFDCWPLEGAYALYLALQEKYAFVGLKETPGFFGDDPPRMIGIPISVDETIQVPWGILEIPGIEGYLKTQGRVLPDGKVVFVLTGQVKRRNEKDINDLTKMIKKYITTHSIYKGKAFRVEFNDNLNNVDLRYTPKFIDTREVNLDQLIFPSTVRRQVEASVFTPICKTSECRAYGIPLKRGILLEGPYGTGKTLTAYCVAKLCEENGWTFIMLEDVSKLAQAIHLARQYQPAVIFAEDIDRAMCGNRSFSMDDVLNTIDGLEAKDTEVMVILTTNHVDQINRAMLRPGRLDDVIPVRPPDAAAAEKLLRHYAGGLISPTVNLESSSKALSGLIPAVIREVVERAKLMALLNNNNNDVLSLTNEDILTAAYTMKQQLELLETKQELELTPLEKAAHILASRMFENK